MVKDVSLPFEYSLEISTYERDDTQESGSQGGCKSQYSNYGGEHGGSRIWTLVDGIFKRVLKGPCLKRIDSECCISSERREVEGQSKSCHSKPKKERKTGLACLV
jgi:hypothetical protein